MKNSLLKKLIFEELSKILKETAPVPDADENSVFGKYLWADKNNTDNNYSWKSQLRSRIRKDKAVEQDTGPEKEFLAAFYSFIEEPTGNNGGGMAKIINKFLRPAKQSGLYSKYINPPNNVPLYRGINLSVKAAAKLLRLKEEEIIENPQQAWYVENGGILQPKTRKVMSWTINPDVAIKFGISNEHSQEKVSVILVTNSNNGDFYLNPINLNKKFDFGRIDQNIIDEKEVMSYGPVAFTEAAFVNMEFYSEYKHNNKNIAGEIIDSIIADFMNGDTLHNINDKVYNNEYMEQVVKYAYSEISQIIYVLDGLIKDLDNQRIYNNPSYDEYVKKSLPYKKRIIKLLDNMAVEELNFGAEQTKNQLLKALAIKKKK